MSEQPNLESLYAQAQAAIKVKDYEHASELLRQIVVVDETYRAASRLLANVVALQRRRWYNDPRLWGAVGVFVLVMLGVVIGSQLPTLLPAPTSTPTMIALAPSVTVASMATATRVEPTKTVTPSPVPTNTLVSSVTPTRAPTAIPFTWKRLYSGQEFQLDSYNKMVLDPRDSDIIYMSSINTGIYKTIDGGISWQPANNGLGTTVIQTLVIDPKDSQILYAGLNRAGTYKTTDGGNTWRPINQGIGALGGLSAIVMDPNNNRHLFYATNVYATTANAFYESLDAGEHWSQVKESRCPNNNSALVPHPTESQTLFILAAQPVDSSSCDVGIYKSQDAGRTWTLVGLKGNLVTQLVISPKQGNLLYASTGEGMYGSTDGGNTWNRIRDTTTALIFDWDGNIIVTGGTPPIAKSSNNGKTWQPLYATTADWNTWRYNGLRSDFTPSMIAFSLHSRDTVYLGGPGFAISTDGGISWTERSNGLGIGKRELKIYPTNKMFLYSAIVSGSYFISTNGGYNWDRATQGNARSLAFVGGRGLAFDAGGKIYYMSGGGNVGRRTIEDYAFIPPQQNWPSSAPMRITAHPRQPGLVYATFYSSGNAPYIYFSLDGLLTSDILPGPQMIWQKASGVQSMSDLALYFDYDQGQVMYAISGSMNASRSNDAGRTWENCGNPNAPNATTVVLFSNSETRLVVDPRNSNRLLAASRGGGVWASDDGCKTWAASNTGLGNLFVITLAIDPKNPNRVYAGTDGGAFISNDSGKSWFQVNDGLLGATVIYSIVVDPKDSSVYSSTPYGIFKLESK